MPHAWNLGQVRPHIHVEPMADPAVQQIARFTIRYTWTRHGLVTPLLIDWPEIIILLPINPGDLRRQMIVDFGLIDPRPNPEASDILLWVASRTGTNAADTYTTNKGYGTGAANMIVHSFDVHYRPDKAGTVQEF